MNTIGIRNITVQLPSEWNEISKRTLLYLCERMPYTPTKGFAISLFFHFLDLPRNIRLSLAIARNFILSKKINRGHKKDGAMFFGEKNFWEQNLVMAMAELDDFSWVHKEPLIEKCLIRTVRVGFTRFYGPDDVLCNVTAEEFEHADRFLFAFIKQKDENFLNLFVATLWREKSPNPGSDVRVPFDEFALDKRAARIRRLSPAIKQACIINYLGMRQAFISTPDGQDVFNKKSEGSGSATEWNTIMLRLAENSVFGTHSQTKRSFIHDIVAYMADLKYREATRKKNK